MYNDNAILALFLIFIFLLIYFIPTIVAAVRGHRNALAIFFLNLFLGYTFLGWVGALIWAVIRTEKVAAKRK